MSHVGDRAFELVLGVLPDDEAVELSAHVEGCEACAAEVARAADEAAMLAVAEAPPLAPSPEVKARLDRSLASFTERLAEYLEPLAKMADLARDAMADILRGMDDAATWLPGPGPGLTVAHVPNGPATANAISGFVRIPAGGSFPTHTHQGKEVVLVVQGSYEDSDGRVYKTGDVSVREPGTTHSLTALPGPDLIYLAVVDEGIDIDGDFIDSEDERF